MRGFRPPVTRADRLAELEQLCRTKVGEVLQAYLEAEANELVGRVRYERIEEGAPLSASTIARVNAPFHAEFDAWRSRRLDREPFVYIWADGVHLGAGPAEERCVILVVIGADPQGKKHLVALDEAMSESELSWREDPARPQGTRLASAARGHC